MTDSKQSSKFKQPPNRLTIASTDKGEDIKVEAQYNPATVEFSQTVPWKKPDATTQEGKQKGKKDANYMALEFTGAEGRSVSVELLFDAYEKPDLSETLPQPKGGATTTVGLAVAKLEKLATVRVAGSTKDDERRPHQCVVVWGGTLPSFKCVIESLTTKYTMFDIDGNPLRATCTVKLKEANTVTRAKEK
jgi:hypothetical protein